ncbi:MAG: ABC transporter ATP-binding protein [Candidatus Asgardarchaeia archaeon]
MAFLEAQKLVKYYGRVLALDKVSLSIERGTIYGIVGPNGAGKSTLLKIIMGITRPTFGHIFINGHEYGVNKNIHLRKMMGFIPEKISLYNALTTEEFLSFIARLYDIPREIYEERMKEYAKIFGVDVFLHKYIGTLSKGYQQRVLIVSILIREPIMYLLDEPFYGLDPDGIYLFKKILIEKVENDNALVLVASHILPLIQEFANRIGIIYKGKILLEKEGKIEEGKLPLTYLEKLYLESLREVEKFEKGTTTNKI